RRAATARCSPCSRRACATAAPCRDAGERLTLSMLLRQQQLEQTKPRFEPFRSVLVVAARTAGAPCAVEHPVNSPSLSRSQLPRRAAEPAQGMAAATQLSKPSRAERAE